MNISLIIQIIVVVLQLISQGMSEGEAVRKASNMFDVSTDWIRRFL